MDKKKTWKWIKKKSNVTYIFVYISATWCWLFSQNSITGRVLRACKRLHCGLRKWTEHHLYGNVFCLSSNGGLQKPCPSPIRYQRLTKMACAANGDMQTDRYSETTGRKSRTQGNTSHHRKSLLLYTIPLLLAPIVFQFSTILSFHQSALIATEALDKDRWFQKKKKERNTNRRSTQGARRLLPQATKRWKELRTT